ncbi:uncharacterized protein [Oscarella lobularis]|uniref:uncharacterized protein n=1 Tax=Oscarella lobularis TaxID=121494 RepID=UPI0033137708
MSTRKAEEESKAKKVRKKRKRTHKHKESDARTQSNADGARPTDDTLAPKPTVRYELSQVPPDFKRYYPPEVLRARALFRAECASAEAGRTSSSSHCSSHSSVENDRPWTKHRNYRETTSSTSDTSSDCSETVRWKLKDRGDGLETYKSERRKRYAAAIEKRKLVLAMEKAKS